MKFIFVLVSQILPSLSPCLWSHLSIIHKCTYGLPVVLAVSAHFCVHCSFENVLKYVYFDCLLYHCVCHHRALDNLVYAAGVSVARDESASYMYVS